MRKAVLIAVAACLAALCLAGPAQAESARSGWWKAMELFRLADGRYVAGEHVAEVAVMNSRGDLEYMPLLLVRPSENEADWYYVIAARGDGPVAREILSKPMMGPPCVRYDGTEKDGPQAKLVPVDALFFLPARALFSAPEGGAAGWLRLSYTRDHPLALANGENDQVRMAWCDWPENGSPAPGEAALARKAVLGREVLPARRLSKEAAAAVARSVQGLVSVVKGVPLGVYLVVP
jgi:hypothetical protein